MKKNQSIEYITYKSVILKSLAFFVLGAIISLIFNNKDVKDTIVYTLRAATGVIISLTVVYYFLSGKSFRPIQEGMWFALISISFLPILIITLGMRYVIDMLI